MEICGSGDIYREIKRFYDKKPAGWTMITCPSDNGFKNTFYIGPGGVWQLKSADMYDGHEFGIGGRIDFDLDKYRGPVANYGARPIKGRDLEKFMEHLMDYFDGRIPGIPSEFFEKMKACDPVDSRTTSSPDICAVAVGPSWNLDKEFVLGYDQVVLDQKLDMEMRRLRKKGLGEL
jgi:hypothetical protein